MTSTFFVTIGRAISYAFKDFVRNAWLGLTTAFVLVLALLSVNVVVGVSALVDRSVSILEDKVDVSVFFKSGTPEAVLQQAQFFMASLPQVRDARLLTADEALALFRERHADDPRILQALDELNANPLGASLVIKAKRTDDYPFLLEALKNPQFEFAIESKSYDDHAEAITRVREIGNSARAFGAILIGIFALFSVMIVYHAVRVAIYTQREEIGIMRLVGASGVFVRMPFVIEGLIMAGLAVFVAAFLVWGGAAFFDPKLKDFLGADPGLATYFRDQGLRLFALEGGGLALLVALSSWAAVGKYLKK